MNDLLLHRAAQLLEAEFGHNGVLSLTCLERKDCENV